MRFGAGHGDLSLGARGEPARRAQAIQPFRVMQILAEARAMERAGRRVIHMEVGEPDFPTATPIVEAGRAALAAGHTHYTPAVGLPVLREAIASRYAQHFEVEASPQRVVVTPGASGALHLALAALLDAGDEVLLSDPGYPCNRHLVQLLGGVPVAVTGRAEAGYQPEVEDLERARSRRTRALLLASPANPTGAVLDAQRLGHIGEWAARHGIALVADEIYQGLTYGKDSPTALHLDGDVFVVNSFSKYFGMTGWRVGWLLAPEAYMECLDRLAQNLFLAASTPAQHAALAALTPPALKILEQRRVLFQERRDFLLPALHKLGFQVSYTPQGAFYVYADSRAFADDSLEWCQRLLRDAGVAITPGCDFGHVNAEQHVRFAYTTDLDSLAEGIQRLDAFIAAQ